MAKIVKAVRKPHDCDRELEELGREHNDLLPGTEARCSCGSDYFLREDQMDGMYWAEKMGTGRAVAFYKPDR